MHNTNNYSQRHVNYPDLDGPLCMWEGTRGATLHIFSPEHDLALASGLSNFTSPKAGRQLRSDLGFLPLIWAREGDAVLVDDIDKARERYEKIDLPIDEGVTLVDKKSIGKWCKRQQSFSVSPWGWDATIRQSLIRYGVPANVMPTEEQIDRIRELSNRAIAVQMLKELRQLPQTEGESKVCITMDEVKDYLKTTPEAVLKAPWSSSGRGVRYVTQGIMDENLRKWVSNAIERQGSVVTEKKCSKVMDFAVEFIAEDDGVHSCGLSLFSTQNAAYTGNILAPEKDKWEKIGEYIPESLLRKAITGIEEYLTPLLRNIYKGPLGVDMMITAKDTTSYSLNPCVEINLRRTMGHVALDLTRHVTHGTMTITGLNTFTLTIKRC